MSHGINSHSAGRNTRTLASDGEQVKEEGFYACISEEPTDTLLSGQDSHTRVV